MTQRSADTEFSFRLTESLLSQTPNSSLSSTGAGQHYHHNNNSNTYNNNNNNNNNSISNNNNKQYNSLTPRLVSPLPSNAIVVQPRDSSSSFNNYIEDYFKQDSPVLLDRLSVATPHQQQQQRSNNYHINNGNTIQNPINSPIPSPTSTFWAYLSNDLDSKPPPPLSELSAHSIDRENEKYFQNTNTTWLDMNNEYDDEPFFSVGAFLFLFGFIIPPLWWIGSFIPKTTKDTGKMSERWRLLNRYFSLGFSSLLIIAIIILAVIYSVMY